MGEANTIVERKVNVLKGLRAEFKKIIWPNLKTLTKSTTTVIVVSLGIGLVITIIDFLLNQGIYQFLLKL